MLKKGQIVEYVGQDIEDGSLVNGDVCKIPFDQEGCYVLHVKVHRTSLPGTAPRSEFFVSKES